MGRKDLYTLFFLSPFFFFFIMFLIVPIAYSLAISFTNMSGLHPYTDFIGLHNYLKTLQNPLFLTSLRNVAMILFIQVPVMTLIALALALLLNSELVKGRNIFRPIIYLPLCTSTVVASLMWNFMYGKDYGLINTLLSNVGLPKVDWVTDSRVALYSIMNVITWRWIGWNMVLFLAGLAAIPQEIYDSAKLDAGRFQTVRYITLPLLKPMMVVSIILSINGSLQTFTEPLMLTGGGPGYSTQTLIMSVWRFAWGMFSYGYAAAASWIVGLIVFFAAIIYIRYVAKGWSWR